MRQISHFVRNRYLIYLSSTSEALEVITKVGVCAGSFTAYNSKIYFRDMLWSIKYDTQMSSKQQEYFFN